MIVYVIPIIMCLILYFFQHHKKWDEKKTKIYYAIMIIFLFLISAIRYNVGKDYQHWIDVYNYIEKGIPGGDYVEIGYKFLNIIIQKIPFLNVYFLYILTSAFIVFGFGFAIKKNVDIKYWFVSIFLFIGTGIFFASLNLVRQYVSIVIILISLPLLKDKKYIKFGIMIVLASLFHTSAIIMLPFIVFYMIFRTEKYNKALVIIYIISLIFIIVDLRQIFNLISFIIPERWAWYLQSELLTQRNYSAVVKQLVPNILLIFVMLKRKNINNKKEDVTLYMLMLYANVIITNCFYGVLVLLRFSYYFDISLIFIIPIILEMLKEYSKKIQILGNISIWGYYTLLTVVTIFIMNGHGVMPYQTIFSLLK